MRQITERIVRAFLNGESRKIDNSETDGEVLYLHGHAIARHTKDGIEVRTAGWNTVTTRERLNGLCYVCVCDGWTYLGGKIWLDSDEWTPIDNPNGLSAPPKSYSIGEYDELALKRLLNREGYEYALGHRSAWAGTVMFHIVGDGRTLTPMINKFCARREAGRERDKRRAARREQVRQNLAESARIKDSKWRVGATE